MVITCDDDICQDAMDYGDTSLQRALSVIHGVHWLVGAIIGWPVYTAAWGKEVKKLTRTSECLACAILVQEASHGGAMCGHCHMAGEADSSLVG